MSAWSTVRTNIFCEHYARRRPSEREREDETERQRRRQRRTVSPQRELPGPPAQALPAPPAADAGELPAGCTDNVLQATRPCRTLP